MKRNAQKTAGRRSPEDCNDLAMICVSVDHGIIEASNTPWKSLEILESLGLGSKMARGESRSLEDLTQE